MNIVHIIPSLSLGGAETALSKIVCTGSVSNENTHSIICIVSGGQLEKNILKHGILINVLSLQSILDYPKVLFSLIRLIYRLKPDVIHTWMYHANLVGGMVAKIMGCNNIVWAIRTTDSVGLKASKSSRLIRKLNALFSSWIPSYIIYVAEAAKLNHEKNGYNNKFSTVIPNGFDTLELSPTSIYDKKKLREQLGISRNQIVIGSVGRFNIEKDHETFISACGILLKEQIEFKILLVGRELTPDNQLLAEWIKATGCIDQFVLCGEQSKVVPYFSIMDIFCLHSRNEGFPNVLGEAMSIGLPCVATDVGDAGKLVKGLGIVTPKEDPKSLASGLRLMIRETKAEREAIGKASRARIIKQYSLKSTMQSYEDLYKDIIR